MYLDVFFWIRSAHHIVDKWQLDWIKPSFLNCDDVFTYSGYYLLCRLPLCLFESWFGSSVSIHTDGYVLRTISTK